MEGPEQSSSKTEEVESEGEFSEEGLMPQSFFESEEAEEKNNELDELLRWVTLSIDEKETKKNKILELVMKGADPNRIFEGGSSALIYAIESGDQDFLKFMVQNGGDAYNLPKRILNTLSEEQIKELKEAFPITSINQKFFELIKSGNRGKFREFLADKSAHVNKNYYDKTPLEYAVAFYQNKPNESRLDIIKELINAGADINKKDRKGTPLIMQLIPELNLELIKLFIEKGVDTTQTNKGGISIDILVRERQEQYDDLAQFLSNNVSRNPQFKEAEQRYESEKHKREKREGSPDPKRQKKL